MRLLRSILITSGVSLAIAASAQAEAAPDAARRPSDYPAFTQRFDGPLVVTATNRGSRRWSCNASWLEGYDEVGRLVTRSVASHFYVHPHATNELALRRNPVDRYIVLGGAEIDCSA